MTTTITLALLLIGASLAGFGTLAFLAAVPANPDPTGTQPSAPDVETLRLTWLAARHGRTLAVTGIALWLAAHPTVPAPYALLILSAGAAATGACLVTRAAPELMKRAALWTL